MTRLHPNALVGLAVLVAVAVTVRAPLSAGRAQERTIYVTVMDNNGAPVGDIKADEFVVKQDGATRTITKVERASKPLHYAILVDTTRALSRAVNDIREGLKGFTDLLLSADPSTEFSFVEFGGAAMEVMPATSDPATIQSGLGKLMPKPSEPVLNEALVDVSKRLAKLSTPRRVILTINMEPTVESTNIQAKQVAAEVQKSGAVVWSIALQEGARRDTNREQLLKGLAANTGGRWIVLQGQSMTQLGAFLRSIAANSFQQYAVTFTPDPAGKPAKVTDVSVTRPGVAALSMKWSSE
jgi:VWFA-related protein